MLTLHPAPGEVFSLKLKTADELFQSREAPLVLKVGCDTSWDCKLFKTSTGVELMLQVACSYILTRTRVCLHQVT